MFRGRHFKNTKPRKPPNTDPYQSILNLNDDCLYVLLTYLPLQDLCSIGTTCRRINQTADRVYSRFANLDAKCFLTKNHHNLTTERKMGMIVKQIARHIKSFHISTIIEDENNSKHCETLIKLVLIHCCNIIELKIDFYISDLFSQEICALENFQKLETIQISSNIQLENLRCLKHLYLITGKIKNPDYLMLKNLESLCLSNSQNIDSVLFSQICDRNLGMKRLKIFFIASEIVNLIVTKLVHLEDITLMRYSRNMNLIRISEIKTLKRFTTDASVPDLLAKLVELDQLELLSYISSEEKTEELILITKLTKLNFLRVNKFNDALLISLKSLRTLEHLDLDESNSVTNEGILNFVKNATNLKYLSLCQCFMCDDDIFEMLTELIKNSNRKLKLTVRSDFIFWHDTKEHPLLNIIVEPYREEHCYYNSSS